jgi:hypothetical protein
MVTLIHFLLGQFDWRIAQIIFILIYISVNMIVRKLEDCKYMLKHKNIILFLFSSNSFICK